MQNRACIWTLAYTSPDKTLLTRIRLMKCVSCTELMQNYADCIVTGIDNKIMIIRSKT